MLNLPDGTLFCRFANSGIGGMAGGILLKTAGNGGTGGGGAISVGKFATNPLSLLDFRADRCNSVGNVCGIERLSSAR